MKTRISENPKNPTRNFRVTRMPTHTVCAARAPPLRPPVACERRHAHLLSVAAAADPAGLVLTRRRPAGPTAPTKTAKKNERPSIPGGKSVRVGYTRSRRNELVVHSYPEVCVRRGWCPRAVSSVFIFFSNAERSVGSCLHWMVESSFTTQKKKLTLQQVVWGLVERKRSKL